MLKFDLKKTLRSLLAHDRSLTNISELNLKQDLLFHIPKNDLFGL